MEKQIKILKEFEKQEWVTKSGEKIKIKDLELYHLKNIVAYLRKRWEETENPMNDFPSFQGEMAQYYAEQQWNSSLQRYEKMKRKLQLFETYYYLKSL